MGRSHGSPCWSHGAADPVSPQRIQALEGDAGPGSAEDGAGSIQHPQLRDHEPLT